MAPDNTAPDNTAPDNTAPDNTARDNTARDDMADDNIAPGTVPPGSRCADPAVIDKRLAALRCLIGNTPLLAVHCLFKGRPVCVYAKMESKNFTGSIKDRMALHILEDAYRKERIHAGDTIVEATSGNTGISFAAIGRALGHPVRIYIPDWMSGERIKVIKSMGTTVVLVSAEEGGFVGAISKAEEFAAEGVGVFHPRQFESPANIDAHYETTGPEVLRQLASAGVRPTAFLAGVGTGGTVMGAGSYLREQVGTIAVHPLEPAESPTLRTGCKVGKHRIQGISDEFIPPIVDLSSLDHIVDAWDGDAILMAQLLASQMGLAVGISSGANFLGALQVAEEQGTDAVVATVFADSNKKYLSTDLCGDEPVKKEYLSQHVELLSMQVFL
jgi:cysteine synthase A